MPDLPHFLIPGVAIRVTDMGLSSARAGSISRLEGKGDGKK
jgi:hypothetical protein